MEPFVDLLNSGVPDGLKRGRYKVIGHIDGWQGGNVQFVDIPFSIAVEGDEIKRQRLDKLDVLESGRVVMIIEVVENFVFSVPLIIAGLAASGLFFGGAAVVVDQIGDASEQAQGAIEATSEITKQILIGLAIAVGAYLLITFYKK